MKTASNALCKSASSSSFDSTIRLISIGYAICGVTE